MMITMIMNHRKQCMMMMVTSGLLLLSLSCNNNNNNCIQFGQAFTIVQQQQQHHVSRSSQKDRSDVATTSRTTRLALSSTSNNNYYDNNYYHDMFPSSSSSESTKSNNMNGGPPKQPYIIRSEDDFEVFDNVKRYLEQIRQEQYELLQQQKELQELQVVQEEVQEVVQQEQQDVQVQQELRQVQQEQQTDDDTTTLPLYTTIGSITASSTIPSLSSSSGTMGVTNNYLMSLRSTLSSSYDVESSSSLLSSSSSSSSFQPLTSYQVDDSQYYYYNDNNDNNYITTKQELYDNDDVVVPTTTESLASSDIMFDYGTDIPMTMTDIAVQEDAEQDQLLQEPSTFIEESNIVNSFDDHPSMMEQLYNDDETTSDVINTFATSTVYEFGTDDYDLPVVSPPIDVNVQEDPNVVSMLSSVLSEVQDEEQPSITLEDDRTTTTDNNNKSMDDDEVAEYIRTMEQRSEKLLTTIHQLEEQIQYQLESASSLLDLEDEEEEILPSLVEENTVADVFVAMEDNVVSVAKDDNVVVATDDNVVVARKDDVVVAMEEDVVYALEDSSSSITDDLSLLLQDEPIPESMDSNDSSNKDLEYLSDSSADLLLLSKLQTIEQLEQQIKYRLDKTASLLDLETTLTTDEAVVEDVLPIDQQQFDDDDRTILPELSNIDPIDNLLFDNIVVIPTTTDVDTESWLESMESIQLIGDVQPLEVITTPTATLTATDDGDDTTVMLMTTTDVVEENEIEVPALAYDSDSTNLESSSILINDDEFDTTIALPEDELVSDTIIVDNVDDDNTGTSFVSYVQETVRPVLEQIGTVLEAASPALAIVHVKQNNNNENTVQEMKDVVLQQEEHDIDLDWFIRPQAAEFVIPTATTSSTMLMGDVELTARLDDTFEEQCTTLPMGDAFVENSASDISTVPDLELQDHMVDANDSDVVVNEKLPIDITTYRQAIEDSKELISKLESLLELKMQTQREKDEILKRKAEIVNQMQNEVVDLVQVNENDKAEFLDDLTSHQVETITNSIMKEILDQPTLPVIAESINNHVDIDNDDEDEIILDEIISATTEETDCYNVLSSSVVDDISGNIWQQFFDDYYMSNGNKNNNDLEEAKPSVSSQEVQVTKAAVSYKTNVDDIMLP